MPSLTSEQPAWEPPDWLLPEAEKFAAAWWLYCEDTHSWPETFTAAFCYGYVAGYERGQRRRKVDGTEDT